MSKLIRFIFNIGTHRIIAFVLFFIAAGYVAYNFLAYLEKVGVGTR